MNDNHSRTRIVGLQSLAAHFQGGDAVFRREVSWRERLAEVRVFGEHWHGVEEELMFAQRCLADIKSLCGMPGDARANVVNVLVSRVRHAHTLEGLDSEQLMQVMQLAQACIDKFEITGVNGVAPRGTARRNDGWLEQSDIYRSRLFRYGMLEVSWSPCRPEPPSLDPLPDLSRPDRRRKTRPHDADVAGQPEVERDGPIPSDWKWFGHTRGKRVLIIGGEGKQRDIDRIQSAFEIAQLDWPPTAHRSRYLGQLPERIRNGALDLVIILPWSRHSVNEAIEPVLDRSGISKVRVDIGYGISAIRRSIERWLPPL